MLGSGLDLIKILYLYVLIARDPGLINSVRLGFGSPHYSHVSLVTAHRPFAVLLRYFTLSSSDSSLILTDGAKSLLLCHDLGCGRAVLLYLIKIHFLRNSSVLGGRHDFNTLGVVSRNGESRQFLTLRSLLRGQIVLIVVLVALIDRSLAIGHFRKGLVLISPAGC